MVPRITVYVITIIFCATIARAEERKLDSLKNSELVELLASKNPPPQMEAVVRATLANYPKGYDHEKQRVVLAAANELRKRGVKAFPDLVRALDDQRYSCLKVGDTEKSRHLLTVGEMSWFIIATQVDACDHAGIEYGDPQFPSVPFEREKGDVKKWFNSRKDWTLGQFQKQSVQLKQKEREEFRDDPETKQILEQLEKMSQQLSQKRSYFELTGGFIKVGDELLFEERKIKVTLEKK